MKRNQSPRCHFCRRPLTAPRSIALGVGPECAEKRATAIGGLGSSEAEIAEIEKAEPRRANVLLNALAAGGRKDIEFAIGYLARTREMLAVAV